MGDFNTNLLCLESIRSRKLMQTIQSASLHILPLQATHHNTAGEDTWLDLIITSNQSLVSSHGQYPAPGFSHHDLLFLSYLLKPPKPVPKVLYLRSFARMDVERLTSDASVVDWTPVAQAATVDSKVELFNSILVGLYDVHAPVKKIKLKRQPAPWMTPGIRMAMRRRDRAFRKHKRDRTEENWSLYKAARNRCNQMIRNAKRRHIFQNISSSSSADIWKFLRSLGIGKPRNLELPNNVRLDDLNHHFTTAAALDHLTKQNTIDLISGLTRPDIPPFRFRPVDPGEIKKIILTIKSKAVGCDHISRCMIVPILDHLLPVLSHIINFSLQSGAFPSLWRKAFVRPLPKIPNPTLPNHFRPISILPFLSKVLEACVHKQFSAFVHKNNLISPLQSGFRPGHSTTSALLKVTGDIRLGLEDTKLTVLVLVDFTNAFNTVSHDILLAILSYLMVSPEAVDWFSSYLQERQQAVQVDNTTSNWLDLVTGVPQGGILSPLLFSIFINLITSELRCAYHLYADDLQLYSQACVAELPAAIEKLNRDLTAIKNWADRFGVAVNPSKCQAIIIGSHHNVSRIDIATLPPVLFHGAVVPYSSDVKDLGLYIDNTFSWQKQVTSVCQKVTGTLRSLYRLKNFLPSNTKTILVQSLILPIIDYGDVCYYDLNAELLNKLDRLLNNCIRFVFNLRKYDHVSPQRALLKWFPIRQRRQVRVLTTLYSLLNSPSAPVYLSSSFPYLCTNHSKILRSSNNRLLSCPSHHSNFLHSSFFVQAILLWNALPQEIRMAPSRLAFKMRLRSHIAGSLAH